MPATDHRNSTAAVITALRWVAVTIGCVFAADSAIAGEVRGVFAVGLGVLVAVWWTLRPQLVDMTQDVFAALVLVGADILSDRPGAFIPAIIVALLPILGRRWLRDDIGPESEIDDTAHSMVRAAATIAPDHDPMFAEPSDTSAEIVSEERRRAGRLYERVAEWLTYVQITLDRHLTRRPDHQLSKLRDEITESIREVEERSRQLRARVTPSAPLASHAGRLLEWWSHHHASDVTLRITDPDSSLDPAVEQQFLTILQEAVENVGRHADAEHLRVRWEVEASRGILEVSDDGSGFDVGSTDGRGLAAMKRAARRAGATLEIDSTVGEGTTVTATVGG